MNLTPSELLFGYVASALAALVLTGLYYELRRRRFEPPRTDDNVFRCDSCEYVYTDDSHVERSRCPNCGAMNRRFTF